MPYDATNFAQSIIVDLDLDKVALCNQGANSRANILLTKRKENSKMPENFEELVKALTDEQAAIVTAHIAALEKAHADEIVAKDETITELNADITTLKEETAKSKPEGEEKTPEDLLKSVSPELATYVETLQKSVNALVAEQEETLAKTRFEAVKALPVEEEALKAVLKSASPAMYEILVKAANAVETTVLKGKGKDLPADEFVVDANSAYESLSKSANKIMAEEVGKTFEQAFVEACSNDPETYATYVKGAR